MAANRNLFLTVLLALLIALSFADREVSVYQILPHCHKLFIMMCGL